MVRPPELLPDEQHFLVESVCPSNASTETFDNEMPLMLLQLLE